MSLRCACFGERIDLFILRLGVLVLQVCKAMDTTRHETVTVMGRSSFVYIPQTGWTWGSRPAIFVLHGSYSTPSSMFDLGFEELAEKHNFLVVYPEMAIPAAPQWAYEGDLDFFAALSLRLQEHDFMLDASRAFVCGHSAGATMSLFLQNEADTFRAAGAVEGAVGHLQAWHMERTGKPTMLVWNHGDPVLAEYAPPGGEPAYYNQTVSTLRRRGNQQPSSSTSLPVSGITEFANLVHYEEDDAPELLVLSFRSMPGTHAWATRAQFPFDSAELLTQFFLKLDSTVAV
eukprot:TRINITY_DN112278_c0_g1_i1.p1 TRINITY_DN112278_c0_g1~~TRINITY_DN112278_c0_g1_i1.p1  ORF type:complete len:288 (-),score=42.27 TRINITY_DN112278_c0_g1_i1:208-1071(-)